jgi:hypothetical protein
MGGTYDGAAGAWVAHLRAGGSTPWREFWPTASPVRADGELPGAAQLELVRRLAHHWTGGPGFEQLADRVLHREGGGRGLASLPLAHPDHPGGFGAPAIDPAGVPMGELIRVGVAVLADLAMSAPPTRMRAARTGVLGAPITARTLRLDALGLGRKDVVVWAPSFEQVLTEVWAARVQRGSGVRWRRFVELWAAREQLPRSVDVLAVADLAAQRVGAARVHVVVGPQQHRSAGASGTPRAIGLASTDLVRRANPLLDLRQHDPAAARDALVGMVADERPPELLAVPPGYRAWASAQADRIVQGLRSGGYAVHGELGEFARAADVPSYVAAGDVLDRLVGVLVRAGADGQVSGQRQGEVNR